MSQEKLNMLATLRVEKKLLNDINIEAISDDFASKNAINSIFYIIFFLGSSYLGSVSVFLFRALGFAFSAES
jgi:hypothetical protein